MKNSKIVGGIILPFRLVTSWLFLSAVLRRLILAPAKHDMESAKWIGHKINTFFPQANGLFHTILEYLSRNPTEMNWFSYVFTYSELIVGVLLLLGLTSRLTGFLLINLGVGLMHTAGWLGPTCLDEWQIASLITTVGVVILIFGSGSYSLDAYLTKNFRVLSNHKLWNWLSSERIILDHSKYSKVVIGYSMIMLLYVMGTNQLLHGGVWGNLHNDSVKPHFILSDLKQNTNDIQFSAFRDKGPETYGAFVVEIEFLDKNGKTIERVEGNQLKNIGIENIYINQVKANSRSLIFPLGSKATLKYKTKVSAKITKVKITDISGVVFQSTII